MFRFTISIFLLLLCGAVLAQNPDTPNGHLDPRTVDIQTKADDLYRRGHWERAHFIYVHELAAIGDKYAQYMAGYMHLHGQGVRKDPIEASAWYRIAAERGSPEFVAVRDQLFESMSPEALARSDASYTELRMKYSDIMLVLRQLKKEIKLEAVGMTGSRLPTSTGAVIVVEAGGTSITQDEYMRRIRARMQPGLDYITSKLNIEPIEGAVDESELNDLWTKVTEYLGVIDDR